MLWMLAACGLHAPAGYREPRWFATLSVPAAHVVGGEPGQKVRVKKIVARPERGTDGPDLFGLTTHEGGTLLSPRYTALRVLRGDLAIARHRDAATWCRINLDTGEERGLPFAETRSVTSAVRPQDGPSAVIGVQREQNGRWTVYLLDDEAKVAATLRHVQGNEFDADVPPVDYLADGGYVVRFDPVGGERCDMLFDASGEALSPELPPLVRLLPATDTGTSLKQHAIVVDEAAGLLWPVLADGSTYPMADEAIGLRVLPDTQTPRGWAIGWQTDEGDRWAIHPEMAIDAATLLDSRRRALFSDVALVMRDATRRTTYTKKVPTWIGRDAASGTTMAYERDGRELLAIFSSPHPSMSGALRELRKMSSSARHEARALAQKARELWEQRKREAEQRAAAEAAAQRQRYLANRRRVAELIAEQAFATAEQLAWNTSRQSMIDVVVAAQRSGCVDQLLLSTIEVALHAASRKDRGAIRMAMSTRRTQLHRQRMAALPSTPRTTFPSSSQRTTSFRPAPQRNYMQEMRDRVRMNYLSGKQNWYFSGSVVRR